MCQGPRRVPCPWVTSARNRPAAKAGGQVMSASAGRLLGAVRPPRQGLSPWYQDNTGPASALEAAKGGWHRAPQMALLWGWGRAGLRVSHPWLHGAAALTRQPLACSRHCVGFFLYRSKLYIHNYFNWSTRKGGKNLYQKKLALQVTTAATAGSSEIKTSLGMPRGLTLLHSFSASSGRRVLLTTWESFGCCDSDSDSAVPDPGLLLSG